MPAGGGGIGRETPGVVPVISLSDRMVEGGRCLLGGPDPSPVNLRLWLLARAIRSSSRSCLLIASTWSSSFLFLRLLHWCFKNPARPNAAIPVPMPCDSFGRVTWLSSKLVLLSKELIEAPLRIGRWPRRRGLPAIAAACAASLSSVRRHLSLPGDAGALPSSNLLKSVCVTSEGPMGRL